MKWTAVVPSWNDTGTRPFEKVVAASVAVVIILFTISAFYWWTLIRRQLAVLRSSRFFSDGKKNDKGSFHNSFRMIRVAKRNSESGNASSLDHLPKRVQMLSLNPDFLREMDPQWKLISLGDYMSSLRPSIVLNSPENASMLGIPDWLETELQAALSSALLSGLGRQMGSIVLPTLGLHFVQEAVRKVVDFASLRIVKIIDSIADSNSSQTPKQRLTDEEDPFGGIPFSLSAMSSVAELNYQQLKRNKSSKESDSNASSLDLLFMGEVGYALSFHDTMPTARNDRGEVENAMPSMAMIPNPFIFVEHWVYAIHYMERRIAECDVDFDPDSCLLPQPKPVDERWFPDLCLGWGDALCTHSKREVLHNRLMATLLNRLASNYCLEMEIVDPKRSPFVVQMNRSSPELSKPSDFIAALIASGYSVETSVQTQMTTFGVALCVKEIDNSWTNIPLAFFLQDGFSDTAGNESFVSLPHSGLNLEIRGNHEFLFQKVSIQHYLAIEGLCGWHSNHTANVPWLGKIVCTESARSGSDVLDSVRIAGLQAVVVNAVSTCYNLPHGGYGLTGVCNDSAALLELAISSDRKTQIFPLTFIGKFAMLVLQKAYELRKGLKANLGGHPSYSDRMDIASLDRLIEAIMLLPSDTNMAPVDAIEQCRRRLYCQTRLPPFLLMKQSTSIVETIQSDMLQIQSSLYT